VQEWGVPILDTGANPVATPAGSGIEIACRLDLSMKTDADAYIEFYCVPEIVGKTASCQSSKSTFWKRIWPRLRMCLFTPIGSADFSIMPEEMNFQLWNTRSRGFSLFGILEIG